MRMKTDASCHTALPMRRTNGIEGYRNFTKTVQLSQKKRLRGGGSNSQPSDSSIGEDSELTTLPTALPRL
ncbi:hypothetical protein HNY73_011635 [Argiope bruennichi]|uniref:Uncharacterized protein n=1 Tax=Argiope bruennichi TaxID=94029 RepID=A0A8T0F1D5_ARGBR|nr:hypothetical protein HNY73_011635 [Argiope bruennichi]